MVLSTALFGKPAFRNLICNGPILAEDGKKMSKRLKNYPRCMEVINEYGTDALRLYLINSTIVAFSFEKGWSLWCCQGCFFCRGTMHTGSLFRMQKYLRSRDFHHLFLLNSTLFKSHLMCLISGSTRPLRV